MNKFKFIENYTHIFFQTQVIHLQRYTIAQSVKQVSIYLQGLKSKTVHELTQNSVILKYVEKFEIFGNLQIHF